MAISAVNSATSATTTATTTNSTTTFSKDAFLNLLVTQMKYQDPLNPMDSTDFMSQLAQISQVEQLQNVSSTLDSIKTSLSNSNVSTWISSIGKKMNVESSYISNGDQIYLTPASDFDQVVLTLKSLSDGTTKQITINKGESLIYTHDGNDSAVVSITGSKDSKTVSVGASMFRTVKGVTLGDDGTPYLIAGSGEGYSISNVKQIKE